MSWFGKKRGSAIQAYRKYVNEGALQGRRPELVKGGLVQSFRNDAGVLVPGSLYEKVLTDRPILGDKDFIEKVLKESAGYEGKYRLPLIKIQEKMQSIIKEKCKEEGVHIEELRMGSRRHRISEVRFRIGWQLVNDLGIPRAEVARQLGVSTSGVSKILRRKEGFQGS